MRMKDKLIIGKNAIDTPTDFETIQEGIDYLAGLPDSHPKVLIVKEGRYDEYIESRLSNFKLVGAGTVLSKEQARQACAAGAQFIVSPASNSDVIEYCISINMPVFPGCLTPTEIEKAMSYGLKIIKFFPAEQFGGIKTIKAYAAPYQGIRFMPTGGISLDNLSDYMSSKEVAACGGSFMVKKDMLDNEKWNEVTVQCRRAVEIIEKVRSRNNG